MFTPLPALPRPFRLLAWLLLLSGLGTPSLRALAQAPGPATLRGTVLSPSGEGVEFATITLHRATDSAVVKTEFSDARGAFRLEGAVGARYLVSAAQVGYVRYWSPVLTLPAEGLTLPALRLAVSASTALREVTVTGRKPLYERQADRTVVNVADSPIAAGSSALDVLGRSPGVSADGKDNLSLRGRQGLLVVLDGKRVPLTGTELADYLKALPADQVQRIELITNPPAQYDAQGGAGVIAITLKKDQRLGTNGSTSLSYGRGGYGRFTGGFTLNHRRKNSHFFGNYAYAERRYLTRVDFERQYAAASAQPAASSSQANEQVSTLGSHTARVGLDLTLAPRTQLGAVLNTLISQIDNSVANRTQFFDPLGQASGAYTSATAQDLNRPSGSANLNLRHAFADSAAAASFTVDADYGRYQTTRLLTQNVNFEAPAQPNTLLTGNQTSRLSIGTLKLDFSQPLPRRARLEAGVKLTHVRSNNNVAFYNTENGTTTYNPLISNTFQYTENVNAAYLNLRGNSGRLAVQAGLRVEQTNTLAVLAGETTREQHYAQLFPSATVQRTLNERHTLALAVARRIDRPNYVQVNPLRSYFDATSYRAGNPYLVAQTSYNMELTHTYRQKFSTALAYAQTDQPIVYTVQPSPDGGRLVVNQDVNLTTQDYLALTLTAPVDPTKWWTLYANGVFYYSRFRGSLAGTALDRSQPTCQLSANNTFSLPHGWSAELNGTFQSREIWGFEQSTARGQVAAGLAKSLWNKQGSLRLSVSDIFYTSPLRATSSFINFSETFYRREDLRVATATFTYRFGNGKVAAASRRTVGAEEELRRAAGQ